MRLRLSLCLGILALTALSVRAQVATGSLSGVVTDPNGAVVPAAKVTATNDATGLVTETTTTDAGLYVMASLPVGLYTVTVEKVGFSKLSRSNIEIRIAQRIDMDLRLEVGDVQQTITVTAEAPLLETTSSQRGQSISTKFMSTLPLFSGGIRNASAFVGYMPGVSRGTAELSISGSGGRASEVLIDGASLTIPESGGVVFNFPGAEMFGEMKLVTSTYDAEYSRFGGGVQLYVTKSGTNDIHGAAFLNMRRDIWNANAWAFNASRRARPKDRINEIGGSAGGPIYIPKIYDGRNRSFFYFTYSVDQRPITSSAVVSGLPTLRIRNGDFGEVSQLIYDPATTSGATRTPFANNVIPQSHFSKISQKMLAAVPDPTRPTLNSNYDNVNTSVFDDKIWNLKFDHAITQNNRVAFLVTKQSQVNDALTAFPGPLGQGLKGSQAPDNWRVNHDLVLRPTLLAHSTFGYSRTRQLWDNPYQKGGASQFGFPGITGDSDATPRVCFGILDCGPSSPLGADGLTHWGVLDGKVGNGSQINITYHFSQGWTWIRGKHEFKFGGEIRRLQTTSSPIDLAGTNGRYSFLRAETALPTNLAGTGHSFASFLLGLADKADRVALPVLVGNIRYGYHGGYFQDNWKINQKLTLNLGIRYEVPINWHDENGDYSMVDLKLSNPGAGNLPGAVVFAGNGAGRTGQKRFYPTDWSNLGPRAGFAYRIFPKTVLRGGFAIFYQTLGNGGCGCRLGFANPITLSSDGVSGALQWDSGIQAPPGFRPPPLIDPTVGNFAGDMDVMGPNFGKAPRVYNWSFNIQHEFRNFVFDIAYVGNRGHGLNSTIDLNQLPVSRLSMGSLLSQRIDSQAAIDAGIAKPFASFPNNQTVAQALRPYPQYFGVLDRNSGVGRTWYDAMQLKVERRFGSWQLMANYTWSKSLAANHYRQIFSQHFNVGAQDAYNPGDMKAISPFDQPHIVSILNAFDLPFGRGRRFLKSDNFLVNLLIADWTISAAQNYRSGAPIQVSSSNTLANGVLFSRFKKANRGPDAISSGQDRTSLDPNNSATRWFNPNVFVQPGQYELGTVSSYLRDFRQPPVFEENLSLAKRVRFPVADRTFDLVLRADAFNAFNRSNFGVNGSVGNALFGRATGPQQGARIITLGMRLEF